MNEFQKLEQRLNNAGKAATQYTMSISEARDLLQEYKALKQSIEFSNVMKKEDNRIETAINILDGGSL